MKNYGKSIALLGLTVMLVFTCMVSVSAEYETESGWDNVAFNIKKSDMNIRLDSDFNEYDMHEIELKREWMTYLASTVEQMSEVKSVETPLYMAWDETYLYIATSYKPTNFINKKGEDPGGMWSECALQVNLSSIGATGADRLEFGIGVTSDTNQMVDYVWADRTSYTYDPTGNYSVLNENGTIKCEVRIPWTSFLEQAPNQGDKIGVCLVWSMGTLEDDLDNLAQKQLAAGCTGDTGKAAEYFAKITLDAAPNRSVSVLDRIIEIIMFIPNLIINGFQSLIAWIQSLFAGNSAVQDNFMELAATDTQAAADYIESLIDTNSADIGVTNNKSFGIGDIISKIGSIFNP